MSPILSTRPLLALIWLVLASGTLAAVGADTLYRGGPILTMDGDKPSYVEVVTVRDGLITYTGDAAGAEPHIGPDTRVHELQGKAMLPGFIDAHGHFMFALNMVNQVNVSGPPVGPVTDIPALIKTLQAWQSEAQVAQDGWIVGWGYDPTLLKEKRHITRQDLDPYFPEHKVMLIHVSGHGAVLNSRALSWAGITADTATPAGGIINRLPGSQEPAGLVMETAYLPVFEKLPKPDEAARLELVDAAQMMYAKEGYVQAQEGFTHMEDIAFLRKAAAQGRLFLDIVALPGFTEFATWKSDPSYQFGQYQDNLKLQGIKITQDGSPQGKTAYVTEPYLTGGPDGQKDWRGETTLPKQDFIDLFKSASAMGLQVFVHANGDATIDQLIEAVKAADIDASDDRRTVAIHSQFQRPDHLEHYRKLGISPSYFTNHTFFWGDVHISNIGFEKASFISPVKSATSKGIIYSNHTDFNVTPLNPFFVLTTAIERETRSGRVLGEFERVDIYTALQGLTTGPAWQVFEEASKGKIKQGYRANFVILSSDPMRTELEFLNNMQVIETIKDGKSIYAK